MFPRKPVFVALAAAGLAAAAALPVAQSETVFVPELALVDGALCRSPQGRSPTLVRLAVAKRKTGISPAAPAAATAVGGSPPADDPPLMAGLGDMARTVSTGSALAQRYFDQGLRLAWGFNHDEARRAFRKAQRLDPQCAMCWWGEAWVLGPNINAPMEPEAIPPAVAAMAQARALASRGTAQEQALIAALDRRYSADPAARRADLDALYAAAMRAAFQRFPDDTDIGLLYADALMNVSPWDYWEASGQRAKPVVAELVPVLEAVLAKHPDNAAAIHLYIHAVEASDRPERAERYADRLGSLAPGAGHLVHMPSHIYYRIGRYRDSLAANRAAVAVDEAYIAREKPAGVYPLGYYPHNVHFVLVSAEMGGDGATVLDAANKLAALIPDEAARAIPLVQPMKAAPYFAHARFGAAPTVLALPDPGDDLPYIQAVWRYARGIVLVQRGEAGLAAAELEAIERLARAGDFSRFKAASIPAQEVMRIAAHVLRARIAQSGNDLARATGELELAVKLYDALPYMEPPYWPYPVRQTLGALLVLQGRHEEARDVFAAALARTPNNAWALYGLQEAYARAGKHREAREVHRRFNELWTGERRGLTLAEL